MRSTATFPSLVCLLSTCTPRRARNVASKETKFTKPTEKHPEGALYHWCEVEVTYPNGEKSIVDSIIWAKSLEKLPEAFETGKVVSLTTQLQGEGAGFSKVGLPTMRRVDISLFDVASEEEFSIVNDNVIEKEEVI